MKKLKYLKRITVVALATASIFTITGCEFMNSKIQSMKGSISGNEYIASFYSNDGEKFMTMHGERIDLSPNTVREYDYVDGGYNKILSSVVTITIDGKEVENCGSTAIFAEEGLKPDVDFTMDNIKDINSSSDGSVSESTFVAGIVNKYKNMFGKSRVVVIQSQLGDPICAYSGDSVYYEVCEDLPKTTKLSVDGKALYIHRANFQIIDTSLLN
jgi:hypothetical protein